MIRWIIFLSMFVCVSTNALAQEEAIKEVQDVVAEGETEEEELSYFEKLREKRELKKMKKKHTFDRERVQRKYKKLTNSQRTSKRIFGPKEIKDGDTLEASSQRNTTRLLGK